jgi:hypothetical protein
MPRKAAKSQAVDLQSAGRWVFLGGLVIAIVYGLIPSQSFDPQIGQWLSYLLMVLGFVGGILFINEGDEAKFVILTIGLAIFGSSFADIPQLGTYIQGMLNVVTFYLGVASVALVVRNVVGWFRF